jgi:small subunit ribosomal protein S5
VQKKEKTKEERRRQRREERREEALTSWAPRTKTGKLVQSGEIKEIEDLYRKNLPLLEPEIVDYLIPDLKEEVVHVNLVRRTTDSGRKGSFVVTAVVGNGNGYVGVGLGKAVNVKPAIERAVRNAKLKLVKVNLGCGSWECGCGQAHSVPFKVTGSSRSVRITLIPAPRGTGLVCGETAKTVLKMAGVTDVWSKTSGECRTRLNFAKATFDALKQIRKMKGKKQLQEEKTEKKSEEK